jgi:hypothetical protein
VSVQMINVVGGWQSDGYHIKVRGGGEMPSTPLLSPWLRRR